jgi:ABC-type nitrate/sulfonate/bicarbonate transport system permease component
MAGGSITMSENALNIGLAAAAPADDLAAPPPSLWRRWEPHVLGASSIVLLLAVWEVLPRFIALSAGTRMFFTTPSKIAGTLWRLFATGEIWAPLGVSASGFALGLGLSILVGLPLGILLGRSRTLSAMLDPFVTSFNATPRLVFLPLVVLWFGLGLWSKVVIVFIGAVFPILINVVRSFGAREWDIARLVVLPNALPYIVTGIRLAIGRAVLGVVVAEFFGSEAGLGVMMVQASGQYQVDVVFAGLIVFAALSLVMTGLVQLIERRLSRWRPVQAASD